jgi:chemotaxis protein methyltransferase CheR
MTTGPARLLPLRFRHVVFPADVRRRQRVIDVAVSTCRASAPPEEGQRLSRESDAFVQWLFRQAGLDARHYRAETLQRRLPGCLRALHARSLAQARQRLEDHPALMRTAVSTLLIGVSAFFRDPAVFEQLRTHIFPGLLRGPGGLQVWSCGCSDGAEVYSIAILLAELDHLDLSYVLGTDCRPDALERARAGEYAAAALRNVSPDSRARYFAPHGLGWHVIPTLRHAVRWRTADVLTTTEPGIWDAIFFRNTALYLRPEATAPLWERFEALLRPGGVLVLGKAERPSGVKRLVPVGPCLYRRSRG